MTRKPNNLPPADTIYWYGWDEVLRREDLGPCWEWRGPKHRAGYGNIRTKTRDGRQTFVRAHRIMLEHSGVIVPRDLHVLHSCDNPPCIRPDHLRPGTDADNMADMIARGRHRLAPPRPGESNSQARLNWEQVREIRSLSRTSDLTYREIGEIFGVTDNAVGLIVRNERWKEEEVND